MGSRIMHLIIANQIAEKLSINDRNAFLLGGIAPDAVYPKEKSHFFEGSLENYTRTINYQKFLENYKSRTDYILGYYTHLIADYVWHRGFYLGWLKNRMEHDEALQDSYHQDFRLLNGKLLHHYQLKDDILDTLELDSIQDLDEVEVDDVKSFIPYVKRDMNYPKEDLEASLQVFTMQQMIGYLETSIDMGIIKLQEVGIT